MILRESILRMLVILVMVTCYSCFTRGLTNEDFGKAQSFIRKDEGKIKSSLTKVNCDDEDDCGSGFVGSNERGKDKGTYEVMSKEVHFLDPLHAFMADGSGEHEKPSKTTEDENNGHYEVMFESMLENSVPSNHETLDAFTGDSLKNNSSDKKDDKRSYEVISISMENLDQFSKDCDDEDACGSAQRVKDVFDGDSKKEGEKSDGNYEIISLSVKEQIPIPFDTFMSEERKGNGDYDIISQSTSPLDKVINRDCDDEDDCGSAADVFRTKGNKDKNVQEFPGTYEVVMTKIIENDKSPSFHLKEPSGHFGQTKQDIPPYKVVSKSIVKISPDVNCDDEDGCDERDTSQHEAGSGGSRIDIEWTKGKEFDTNGATYEIISRQLSKLPDVEELPIVNCDDEANCYSFDERRALSPQVDEQNLVHCKKQAISKIEKFIKQSSEESPCSEFSPDAYFFSGTSFAKLPSLGPGAQDYVEIELEILPIEETGIFLYNGWQADKIGDFLSLSLNDGVIEFSFNCRSGPVKIRSLISIEANTWTKIKFFRTGRLGSLTINERHTSMGVSPEPRSALTLQRNLLVGGVPKKLTKEVEFNVGVVKGFHGHIRQLKIQGRTFDLNLAKKKPSKNLCVPSPCRNKGKCFEEKEQYTCLCMPSFVGRHCEIDLKPVSFNGRGFVRFNTSGLMEILKSDGGILTFSLKTTMLKGILLWESRKVGQFFQKYVSVGLSVGFVSLSYNLGAGKHQFFSKVAVNDGEWHEVSIERKQESCHLIVDGANSVDFDCRNKGFQLESAHQIFIGGVPNPTVVTKRLYTNGFQGCLRDFVINLTHLDFTHDFMENHEMGVCNDV
ncbi:uncharacterized protein LOC124456121 isoform X2 [Xenia sp. Carnegie-2017]|uniref:uncharacterized protein LOC124456121 isoform X2 n=1 Tax=Xenia sp. Carnegie-2017 TaxID=2897299 RepID=UPI001F04E886|nr:uncharacterized protein LOC124456121 isoform X2 [Xenia sp. Carnegie-2017]